MGNPRWLNITVGIFILSGILAFAWLALSATGSTFNLFGSKPIQVTANFSNIGSLKARAPVVMSGVRVGKVADIELDSRTFSAVVTLDLEPHYQIPKDSVASIQTAGLVGEQYISLATGASQEMLVAGDHLALTKAAVGLESLIESFGGGSKIDDSTFSGEPTLVTAHFTNIGSLKVNAPVTISGVNVGRVASISLDPVTFDAVVELALHSGIEIPKDTGASIYTAGLIGGQYIALDPGGSFDNLESGDRLRLTQSAVVLERLIGQFLTSLSAKEGTDSQESE